MAYSIRPYRDSDADRLAQVAVAAITAIGSRAYSSEQVGAWSGRHAGAEMYRRRAAEGHVIFVAADSDDVAVAYALLEPDGHLDRLYNHPDHSRRGLAARLLAEAEHHARAIGIKRLFTEASELARPAFERAGFTVLHRREFEIEHDGAAVEIHNYAMEKLLS